MAFQRQLLPGALVFALLSIACRGDREERAFDRLERLVFVPAGTCLLFPFTLSPVDCSNPEALLVDAFEVTRREWQEALAEGSLGQGARQAQELFWTGDALHVPATGMTLGEAQSFAAAQNMRLPTAKEWVRVAAGTRAQEYPWKTVSHASVANTAELGLDGLAPVGTFHAGSTPSGVHDLSGNAAEWVTSMGELTIDDSGGEIAWAMGGSYLTRQRRTYRFDSYAWGGVAFNAMELHPEHRGADVGLRLIADAEPWLRSQAPLWPTGRGSLERLRKVGRKWGKPAVPLLRRLVQQPDSGAALGALLAGAEE